MEFETITGFYEHVAKPMSFIYGKKYGVIHPAVHFSETNKSLLRSRYAAEEFICARFSTEETRKVLDLGSGFAASMLYLSNIFGDIIFSGICCSESELDQSRSIIRELDKVKTVLIFKGDFEETRNYRVFPTQDLVYSIDSFRHVREPAVFFSNVAALLEPGASFIMIDCFSSKGEQHTRSPKLVKFLATSACQQLLDLEELLTIARTAGFELISDENWTSQISRLIPQKLWDLLMRFSWGLINRPIGTALKIRSKMEQCLTKKVLEYHALEFKRI